MHSIYQRWTLPVIGKALFNYILPLFLFLKLFYKALTKDIERIKGIKNHRWK